MNSVVTDPEGSPPLIQKPTTVYDPEPVPCNSFPHDLSTSHLNVRFHSPFRYFKRHTPTKYKL